MSGLGAGVQQQQLLLLQLLLLQILQLLLLLLLLLQLRSTLASGVEQELVTGAASGSCWCLLY